MAAWWTTCQTAIVRERVWWRCMSAADKVTRLSLYYQHQRNKCPWIELSCFTLASALKGSESIPTQDANHFSSIFLIHFQIILLLCNFLARESWLQGPWVWLERGRENDEHHPGGFSCGGSHLGASICGWPGWGTSWSWWRYDSGCGSQASR